MFGGEVCHMGSIPQLHELKNSTTLGNMKTYIALLTLLVLTYPSVALAAEFRGGEVYTLEKGQRVGGDLYSAGERTVLSGTVEGDVYTAGGTILIDGTVTEDLVAAGGTLTISGTVRDDVRVAGGTVLISGPITGDLFVAGGTVHVLAGGSIGGDVVTAGGTVTIDGPVRGKVWGVGGDVTLNSRVTGAVRLQAKHVALGSGALLESTLEYSARSEATVSQGAQVRGATTFHKKTGDGDAGGAVAGILGVAYFLKLLMAIVAALAAVLILPRLTRTVVEKKPLGRSALVGFISLIVLPIVAILLMVTVVAFPVGLLMLLGYFGTIILGSIMSLVLMGSLVHQLVTKRENLEVTWKTALLGVGTFYVVGWIPVVGWVIQCGVFLIAYGSVLRTWYHHVWLNR